MSRARLALAVCLMLAAAGAARGADLELRRVILSSGGVGYFEHEARVDGPAELSLPVRLDQVDDVLKSLVVLAEGGGVAEASLPGREAREQIFRDLPFGEEALGSPAALLEALRGAEVRLGGARALAGRVLSITPETTSLPNNGGVLTRHRVALLTASGIEQALLEDADSVVFADAALQAKVGEALASLLAARAQESRTIKLRLTGTGERRVRVAYVVEAPLWKATWRLVAPAAPDAGKARLQGWAVLENMTGGDWRQVELTLVSGNPVTFRQALYQAYHVKRPEVPVEVMGRVLPPADDGVLSRFRGDAAAKAETRGIAPAAAPPAPLAARQAPGPAMDLAPAAAAETQEATTQVAFTLPAPVDAAAGTSLVVPILDRSVAIERLSLYQPQTSAKNPLAAVRLVNDTGTALPPGVVALYEEGPRGLVHVGDARLAPMPAGEDRLLAFAVDQKVDIARDVKSLDTRTSGRIADGVLMLTTTERQATTYRMKAANERRLLLVEHPRDPDAQLVSPKGSVDETRTHYRLRQRLEPGEAASLEVVTERPRQSRIELLRLEQTALAAFARRTDLDPPLRAAFERLAALRQASDAVAAGRAALEKERGEIAGEQKRIRDNLASVPGGSDLQKRYLDTLRRQEDRLEKIEADLRTARADGEAAMQALAAAVRELRL
jgi:hypothetical protein